MSAYSSSRLVSRLDPRWRDVQDLSTDINISAALQKILPFDYELVFLEGIMPCGPAPGVAGLFSGPFSCWYDVPTTTKVQRAHRVVLDFVKRNGPFDGILGFSQGAALAASILLHHEIAHVRSPFRFAIFICSPLPFSCSLEHGIDTRSAFGVRSNRPVRPNCPTTVPAKLMPDADYLRPDDVEDDGDRGNDELFYQMFHDDVDQVRISIPTGHVIGANDEWREHSADVIRLCGSDKRMILYHGGGHELPAEICGDLDDMIETLSMESLVDEDDQDFWSGTADRTPWQYLSETSETDSE